MTDIFATGSKLWNAVYGCWMGKNCGGTLGAPLETGWGKEEPFDVWWYPKLQEGGIPNDDLEMQLLWLKALEEVGPQLTAQHLAQYWLDHIGYNWDEYGFSKSNLWRGLRPPISGNYNNWFKDCMGCPIRTEIFACVAPGHPRIAAKYAYEDAICDHAGGESIHGELFNVAIEAAAFVETDPRTLIDIGLSYVGSGTQTYKAIQAALDAKDAGVDWLEARRRVMRATPHHNAQYSPLNIAFQVIGWLWGDDFGDAICKAVNCGYDTDCTGATLGSYLGIILGKDGLPNKWVQPLGESIATNESWGGLRHASTCKNPIPTNLTDLTNRTLAVAKRVLAYHGIYGDPLANVTKKDLYADESIREMVNQRATVITQVMDSAKVEVDYLDTPAVVPAQAKRLRVRVSNPRQDALHGVLKWHTPAGFTAPAEQKIEVPAHSDIEVGVTINVPENAEQLLPNNRLDLIVQVDRRPAMPSIPVVLVSGWKFRVCGPYPVSGEDLQALLDATHPPENADRAGNWNTGWALDNRIPLDKQIDKPGVWYLQTFVESPSEFMGRVAVGFTGPVKIWFNQTPIAQASRYRGIRPGSDAGGDGKPVPCAEALFKKGFNEILIKFVRTASAPLAFDAHLILSEGKIMNNLVDLRRNRFPESVK